MKFNKKKSFLLAPVCIFVVYLFVQQAASSPQQRTSLLETYIANYERINDYLERKVESEDVEENLAKARQWLEVERARVKGKRDLGLILALERFTQLADVQINRTRSCNKSSYWILQLNDDYLGNWVHTAGGNYPLTRLDIILEAVAYNFATLCRNSFFSNPPRLEYGYKRAMYDMINLRLIEKQFTYDIETNMGTAFELFNRTSAIVEYGSLTDALRLLTAMKLASEDCSEEENFIIIHKNLLVLDSSFQPLTPKRPVDVLIWHYASKFKNHCRYLYPKTFMELIQRFSERTLRTMRVLLSEIFIKDSGGGGGSSKDDAQIETLFKYKFSTPKLVSWAEKFAPNNGNCFHIHTIPVRDLDRTLKALSINDPNRRYLIDSLDTNKTDVIISFKEAKIEAMYEKYLVVPCKEYRETIDKMFEHQPSRLYHSQLFDFWEDESPPYLGFTFGQASYWICEKVINEKGENIRKLLL